MGRIGPGMAEYCFRTCSGIYRKAGVVRRQAARYFLEYFFRKQNCLEKIH